MRTALKPLDPLRPEQRDASDPEALIWLSASAGTGKTHVLTARVLRLLLGGADPQAILCLTFTKAGAAEMAERIHRRLAHWAGLRDDDLLKRDLTRLGEDYDDVALDRARRLFARVLDAPGGGLRIQTIHAFCQTLLAGFPAESGLTPGFRPIEGREEAALARRTLAELIDDAQRGGDLGLIRDVQALSLRLGEGGAETYLLDCARAPDAMAALGSREGVEPRLRQAFGAPLGDVDGAIERACADLDLSCFRAIAAANAAWGTATGQRDADIIAAFLAASATGRAAMLEDVLFVVLTRGFEPRKTSTGLLKADPSYPDHCDGLVGQVGRLLGWRNAAALAALIGAGLRAGQAYAAAYVQAKRNAGLVDFDDLIRATVRLLDTPGMGDWVRYKLDQATDHILVDEAQDTNAAQWAIIDRLAEEFFAGAGARGRATRTIFAVGDFKQAIFGFQGTDPAEFARARIRFALKALHAERDFLDLSLHRSFRSAPAVLELVDRLVTDLGHETMGLIDAAEPHAAHNQMAGRVTLLAPIAHGESVDDDGEEAVSEVVRDYATRLARQVRQWLDEGLWLASKKRPIRPEDILILVRRRADLASLIVARLHAEKVPVAGVDRLRLTAPLGVKDLLAAVRFAVQREDDLSLAGLLVSPLFGWDQDRLYRVAYGRKGALIDAVRASGDAETIAQLDAILARADFTTPYRFLEHLLTGPLDGRRKLLRRLGAEARDPIEELLGAALQFEGMATASLQRFLDWFDRGEVEITRDPSAPLDAVRVMTVHGSKGLEAPLVILADATADPRRSPKRRLDWAIEEEALPVPVLRPRQQEKVEALAIQMEALDRREMQEHWRLLYVALTRAQEHLVIGGSLGAQARGQVPEASWYQAIAAAMTGLGCEAEEDGLWGSARHYRGTIRPNPPAAAAATEALTEPAWPPEPVWLRAPAPKEARPPRPLAPSSLGLDDVPDPPPSAALREAARRGTLLHALFERLPGIPPDRRFAAGQRWLLRSAGVEDEALAHALAGDACRVIADPRFAGIFGTDALAEAPIAAVVDGEVIAGTVDRLLVTPDRILVIDFKTGRRAPPDLDGAPRHHIVQMAAYAAALQVIFPGRAVEAALLYTSGPTLIPLPQSLLEANKPGFRGEEQMQGIAG